MSNIVIRAEKFSYGDEDNLPFDKCAYCIHYYDETDELFRTTFFNNDKRVLCERICEFDTQKRVITDVLFAADLCTILGYREYYYNSDNEIILAKNYKKSDDGFRLVSYQKMDFIVESKIKKVNFYTGEHCFIASELHHYSENMQVYIPDEKKYDEHGNILDEFPSYETYDDFLESI